MVGHSGKRGRAQQVIAGSDCLVLPSEYDGWGAVVSEALLAGTPAICSSACGAAVAVEASGAGGVFASGDGVSLERLLHAQLRGSSWTQGQRAALRHWAHSALSADAGAAYLEAVIRSVEQSSPPPPAPWIASHTLEFPEKIKTFVTR